MSLTVSSHRWVECVKMGSMSYNQRSPVHRTASKIIFNCMGFGTESWSHLRRIQKDNSAFQISNLQNIATDAGGWRLWQFYLASSKGRNKEEETHFPRSPRFNVQNTSWLIVAHMPLPTLCFKCKYFIRKLRVVEPSGFPVFQDETFYHKPETILKITYHLPMSPVSKQMCYTEKMHVSYFRLWHVNTVI